MAPFKTILNLVWKKTYTSDFLPADFLAHLAFWGVDFFSSDPEDNTLIIKDYFQIFHMVFIDILSLEPVKIISR